MMTIAIQWSLRAVEDFSKLSSADHHRVQTAVSRLEHQPGPVLSGITKLATVHHAVYGHYQARAGRTLRLFLDQIGPSQYRLNRIVRRSECPVNNREGR